ncbi:biotin carboxyl carrier protein [Variovorax sp. 1140]|uniref:acetyl-CoA carboxylase biotin carboxyl carrier protein subunit n=1 Tax=Variovorax atrisoli TaxID=3394203 RepID=UPI003394D0A6
MRDVSLTSDVTGSVWKVLVAPGERVQNGQPLVVVESMKMEIEMLAPADAVVTSILVQEGQMVEEDQVLALLCST